MPEDQQKLVAELPRDTEVVRVFKTIAGIDPLPPLQVNDGRGKRGLAPGLAMASIIFFMLEARTISVLIASALLNKGRVDAKKGFSMARV